MKVLYIDAVAGASGDMLAGAMLDMGWPLSDLQKLINAMGLAHEVSVAQDHPVHHSIRTSRLQVTPQAHGSHHGHSHAHENSHRGLDHILVLLERLPHNIGTPAKQVFQRLALAEAQVHGVAVEEIHFHEVGAIDAIVDVVAFCAALAWLAPQRVICSPLPLGRGFTDCAHGRLPLPAPAVVNLLQNVPICAWPEEQETVTPTGAALLTVLVDQFGPVPACKLLNSGLGGGSRASGARPNLLRMLLGEMQGESGINERDTVMELQCNIDDQFAEDHPFISELLLQAGALDVSVCPLLMKKGRPGIQVNVLCAPVAADKLANLLLEQSSTLGVRMQLKNRYLLPRQMRLLDTPWGKVRIKSVQLPGGGVRNHPEAEDVLAICRQSGMSPAKVREQICRLLD